MKQETYHLFENNMLESMGDKMNIMPDHMIYLNGD